MVIGVARTILHVSAIPRIGREVAGPPRQLTGVSLCLDSTANPILGLLSVSVDGKQPIDNRGSLPVGPLEVHVRRIRRDINDCV
jgi:hypothetical protein